MGKNVKKTLKTVFPAGPTIKVKGTQLHSKTLIYTDIKPEEVRGPVVFTNGSMEIILDVIGMKTRGGKTKGGRWVTEVITPAA